MVALSQREVSEGDRFIVVPKSFDLLFSGVKAELGIKYV